MRGKFKLNTLPAIFLVKGVRVSYCFSDSMSTSKTSPYICLISNINKVFAAKALILFLPDYFGSFQRSPQLKYMSYVLVNLFSFQTTCHSDK